MSKDITFCSNFSCTIFAVFFFVGLSEDNGNKIHAHTVYDMDGLIYDYHQIKCLEHWHQYNMEDKGRFLNSILFAEFENPEFSTS